MRNWAGNLEYGAQRVLVPVSIEELQERVRASSRLRVLGSRHSFNDVADTTGDHLSLARMSRRIEIDQVARTVTVDGGIRYGELCEPLHVAGFALHNLASLPHISIAGACATGTHGSGDRSGALGAAVSALDLVTADGELTTMSRTAGADLDGAVVSLGAIGVVTSVTLDIEPTYDVGQDVFEDLALTDVVNQFDELMSSADSVSLFTEWRGPTIDMAWLKRRVTNGEIADLPPVLHRAIRADGERHPIRRMSPEACTPQLGVPGPWFDRLPHFRMNHTPSAGDELQSEYLVPREHGAAALVALDRIGNRIAPLIQVSEVRTVAADGLWLSMAFGRPSVAFHFTWKPDWPAVRELLREVEAALSPFEPRPHWGKLFAMAPDEVRGRYERMGAFGELVQSLDPTDKFRNAFVDRFVFGGS